MQSKSVASHLHRFSERGVVNAVFETIASHPDAHRLLEDLLDRMVIWENRNGVSRHARQEGWVEDFEIYIEPSLSDFGDPDVVVLVKHRYWSQKAPHWEAYFIEAKMVPFLMSSPPTKTEIDESRDPKTSEEPDSFAPPDYLALAEELTGCDLAAFDAQAAEMWSRLVGRTLPDRDFYRSNASTILHELFLKQRFEETHLKPADEDVGPLLGDGWCAYSISETDKTKDRRRKVGNDPVVLRLFRRMREMKCIGVFVALTTDPPPKSGQIDERAWPLGMAVAHRLLKMSEWNALNLGWQPVRAEGRWYETSRLLSWFDVLAWARENGLERVAGALNENGEKFTFWPSCASDPAPSGSSQKYTVAPIHVPLVEFLREHDRNADWTATPRTHPWRATLCRNGRSVFRFAPDEGFTKGYWIQVVSDQKTALDALRSQGLPTDFRLPVDDSWQVRTDTEGLRCLVTAVDALRGTDTGEAITRGRRNP